jgi:hypothetical protein
MKKLILGISIIAFTTSVYGDAAESNQSNAPTAEKKEIKKVEESNALGFKIFGETSTNHYVHSMKRRNENEGKGRGNHLAVEDSRINIEVKGNYLDHEIGFLIGITGNASEGNNPIEENRIKIKGNWGTILAGDTKSASDFMNADTSYFSGGTGGVLGNYKNVINETTGAILSTDLLHKFTPKDQTKLIYVSPNIYGFQAAYNYIPDGAHKGEQKLMTHSPTSAGMATISSDKKLSGQNLHEFVVKFKKKDFYNVNIDWSAAFITGKMRNLQNSFAMICQKERVQRGLTTDASVERHNLSSYSTGLVLSYNGFSIGSEYVDNRNSGQLKILNKANLGKIWTLGIGYNDDINNISLVYLNSKRHLGKFEETHFGHARADNYALTYDRRIVPGFTLYAEGLLVNHRNSNQSNLQDWHTAFNGFDGDVVHSNKGKILITGARINF